MSTNDPQSLRERLEVLSRALETRARDLETGGNFSHRHGAFVDALRARHDAYRQKLESAVNQGAAWEALKSEVELDINALIQEFADWERALDAEAMSGQKG